MEVRFNFEEEEEEEDRNRSPLEGEDLKKSG